jgi:hypothetical protein
MRKAEGLSPKKIFLDRDGDGITDSVDLQLHLSPSCSHPTVLSAIMDLSACLGFETMGMNLPLVEPRGKKDSSFNHHLHIGLDQELKGICSAGLENDYTLGQEDEVSLARTIRMFSLSLISSKIRPSKNIPAREDRKRQGFDLLDPFSNQGFFCNSSKSILPFLLPYKIVLLSRLELNAAAEAGNFAARLGLESLSLFLPLTFPFEEKPKHQRNFIYIGKREDLEQYGLTEFDNVLKDKWDSGIFLLPSQKKIPDVLVCGDEKGLEEILHDLSHLPTDSKGVKDPIFSGIKIFQDRLGNLISKGPSRGMSPPKKFVRNYSIPDEREEILRLLEKGAKKLRLKPKSIKIEVFMVRPEGVRKEFGKAIKRLFLRLGLGKSDLHITVLNSYKPGLSWIKEVVLKEMGGKQIDRIEIAFKEFRTRGLEESTRWLQELYPIDEILSRALPISTERIEFKKDSRMKEVYRVRAWRKGRVIYKNQFSPKWIAQPYLLPFPRSEKVHPCPGWVRMETDGEKVIDQTIKTGIERIWEIYQKEILFSIAKESNNILSKRKSMAESPMFEELRFDIYFDYPMERLGVDEERISPLEALHEDLYFVTLDFFANWMEKRGLKNVSPGRVLPVIHPDFQGKNGKMKFTLIRRPTEALSLSRKVSEPGISLNGIVFNGSLIGADLFITGEKERDRDRLRGEIKSFGDLKVGDFKIEKVFKENHSNRNGLRLIASTSRFSKGKESFDGNRGKTAIPIPMERPIGYREGVRLIQSLKSLQGINVIEEGRSFGGLRIFSIENTSPSPSDFSSHAKRALFKPTFFVNCRHHANEVSSTNAGLKLAYLLATRSRFQEFLKRANVIINPMENVDGVTIMEEMLQLTPTDKLHAGRYNKAGKEYYLEYFNPKTPYGEAKVKSTIWERWLPDICVDDHGFPSHEWDQPFSGYAPFQYREWWIPRALFYFYLPHLEKRADSSQRINSEVLKNWMIKAISRESEIMRRNRAFSNRYSKYRQRWLSREIQSRDPIPCLPLQKRFRRTNYSYRCPHITAVDFITEVADETAHGRYLRTCVNAHLQTNLSILKLLSSFDISVKKLYRYENGQGCFVWYRQRPLTLPLSPPACLREAASAKAGEREGVRGTIRKEG